MTAMSYPLIIDLSETGYGATFPDFPGVISGGDTVSDAVANAKEGLKFHIESMLADKEELPEPSDLDSIELSKDV